VPELLKMSIYDRFSEYYDLIYKDMKDYEVEIERVERFFGKFARTRPTSILDIGCGTGSHALLLAKHGYDVVGIDTAEKMVQKAKEKAAREKVKVDFLVQDMREIRLDKRFDCAICMFGGFGYVTDSGDVSKVFRSVNQHLTDGGLFLFEFWNVGGVRPSPYQSWMRFEDNGLDLYRLSESNLDPCTNVLGIEMHFVLVRENRLVEVFDERHDIRCYTIPEIQFYLEHTGFELASAVDWQIHDGTEEHAPKRDTFRIMAVARKTRQTS